MQKRTTTPRKQHTIEIPNGEVKTLLLNGVRETYPEVPFVGGGVEVLFSEDTAGAYKVFIKWDER
jgi:hypothetical protein